MAGKKFQTPKGTRDILPEEQKYWVEIERVLKQTAGLFGYERIDLPIFEETDLFQRGVGETTDIVEKEMYTFPDRSGTSMTLRPEFTAGIVRAYVQHGMASWPKPVKLWSTGPIFRYERPQAGRYRQFTQFNVEAVGELDPALDFEMMSLAWQIYDRLGFKNLHFQLNSIGCKQCRPNYLDRLSEYYRKHFGAICTDCQKRLDRNPLRLLDCKQAQCQPVIESAPSIHEHLCPECSEHFETLQSHLKHAGLSCQLNSRMVRGLDYYTKTVFEVWAEGIGSQNAVCGGGRYDGLIELLGGSPTPAVGFASGLERISLVMQEQKTAVPEIPSPSVYIIVLGKEPGLRGVTILNELRSRNISGIMGLGGKSFKAQMREADKRLVNHVLILGEDELAREEIILKNMRDGEQKTISIQNMMTELSAR